ncbi:hypothetical protein CHELA1G11_21714 [Hyphomicrobiales bacterium]|nr:hypothetical protein CHELA1G11_21714 [Hyphomicrobiales bacterium]CAH1695536.1 hypothetical protein CHELA1G2_22018 [Hyphomicrobiales bacterium]
MLMGLSNLPIMIVLALNPGRRDRLLSHFPPVPETEGLRFTAAGRTEVAAGTSPRRAASYSYLI